MERAARTIRDEERPYKKRLVGLVKLHSSEAFYGCDDPLKAAVFSALIGLLRQQEEQEPLPCIGRDKELGE